MFVHQQPTELAIKSTPAPNVPAFCLLLVMDDDLIANRIAAIAGKNCSVIRFRNETESKKWLTDNQLVNLIIVDKTTGPAMVATLRSQAQYQLVPLLVTCRFGETHLLRNTLSAGVTDILVINEENYTIQTKIDYYLGLCSQIQPVRTTNQQQPAFQYHAPWWKRAMDIAVSLFILILVSPVLLLVSLLIRLDSKGPVIYKSKRAGANFHVFNMYKFRTMKVNADQLINQLSAHNLYAETPAGTESMNSAMDLCPTCSALGLECERLLIDNNQPICEKAYLSGASKSAKFMKFRNDPRITRLGTFLRNSSIDELPQLVNILVGDMSLVGNRPLPLYEAEKLTSNEFAQRFCGPAGLTGLWQIKKRAKGQGLMSDRERTLLDIDYTNNFSFNNDVQIIWKTFFSLWQKENV